MHLFYIHTWHWMIEAARRIKMACCNVPWSVSLATRSVLWHHRHAQVQTSFLKLLTDMALHMAGVLCTMGWGGMSCVCCTGAVRLQKGLLNRIPAFSVAVPCTSQKIVKCMTWAVYKTSPWWMSIQVYSRHQSESTSVLWTCSICALQFELARMEGGRRAVGMRQCYSWLYWWKFVVRCFRMCHVCMCKDIMFDPLVINLYVKVWIKALSWGWKNDNFFEDCVCACVCVCVVTFMCV